MTAPRLAENRTEKLTRLRSTIAHRMTESLATSAQLTRIAEVDVSRIARLRDSVKGRFVQRHGVKLSFLPFFTMAVAEALRVHAELNATLDLEAGTVTYHDTENISIAVDTPKGLMIPVLHRAGDLSLAGIARGIADLAERTRTNRLTPDDVSGSTFTVTNTGSRGALFDTPIINQPHVAILGVGSVVRRPVIVEDEDHGTVIAPASIAYLALSFDARLIEASAAGAFLATVKDRLEEGDFSEALDLD